MKKLVFASMMALASLSLFSAPMLRAQDSTITIKDPAEYNSYNTAIGQSDPKAKAAALESFLLAYPQSVVKGSVLDELIATYQALNDSDKTLDAARRLLQVDPNSMKAIFISVFLKKNQCARPPQDPQTCDDAAALARKGLLAPRPAGMSDADWKKLIGGTYPVFHSAIAFDDAVSKKDFKGAINEYTAELMLYSDEQTKSGLGLQDTYLLAVAYSQPDAKDLVKAIWFFARAWNFVPPQSKPNVEKQLDYYYNKYHGDLKGLDDVKSQAALTTFPPGTLKIEAAKTPAELAHYALVGGDPAKLNLGDKEYILANGVKEDADKLWALLKDEVTPIPGIVMEDNASAIKVVVTQGVKSSDFIVNLQTPVGCKAFPAPSTDLKTEQEFILASGVKADTDKLSELFSDPKTPIKKIGIEPIVTVIKVAVAQEARDAKIPDFIVHLKTHVACKEAQAAGFVYGQQSKGEAELDGTYDTYTQVPATATAAQTAQIVLRDGVIVPKKTVPVHPKPTAGHPVAHPAR